MACFEQERRVTIGDTCLQGCVYYARIVQWQGEIREHWLLERVEGIGDLLAGGLTLITREVQAVFHRDLCLGDPVLVRLHFTPPDRFASFLHFRFVRQVTGLVHAEGRQTILCAGPGHRLQRWPEAFLAAMAATGDDEVVIPDQRPIGTVLV